VLDEVSEDSTTSSTPAKDAENETSSCNDGSIPEDKPDEFIETCKIIIDAPSIRIRKLEKQPKIAEPKLLKVEHSVDHTEGSRNNSRSFESYMDKERRTSLPRQASDPLGQSNRLHVCSGSLSPNLSRQTSRSRPLQVSSSSISSSSQDLSSSPLESDDQTQTESDEHSVTLVNDSSQFSSSSTIPIPMDSPPPPLVNSSPSDDSSSPSFPNISISEAFISLEDISSSIYESFRSSFEESTRSSPTYLTATPTLSKLPSPFNSPQCSFHSCCSSPWDSPSPLSDSSLSLSPLPQWRSLSLKGSHTGGRNSSLKEDRLVGIATEETDPGALKRVSSCPTKTKRRVDTSTGSPSHVLVLAEHPEPDCLSLVAQQQTQPKTVRQFRGSSFERHDAIDLPDDDEFVTDDTPAKIDALC